MKRLFCGLMTLGLFLALAGQAHAQVAQYTYTTLDVPGVSLTHAYGINASGQIVGFYTDAANHVHGFLLDQGSYTTLDVPGGTNTQANGINASGQIVGSYGDAAGAHGFLLDQGNYATLDVPGASYTQAYGINDSGQIVGLYIDAAGTGHGFLLDQGNYATLDVPGVIVTQAYGINASGQIVGLYIDAAGNGHGFLLDQGSYTTLDVPGAFSTSANGINTSGQIVGLYSLTRRGTSHGFLLNNGIYTTFDVPGASNAFANGINDSGEIVGYFGDASGSHGFLATPVSPVTTFAWHGPTTTITTGVSGNPSFVQATPGTYGTKGNYELVVPLQSGGLAHFYRNNDDPSMPWSGPFPFATEQGAVDAVSLIQSNFSSAGNGPGNLAVVANGNGTLNYYFREDVTFTWSGPTTITTGVSGVPSFVQATPGTYGTKGNYELVTPLQSGGMAHFYRNNDDPSMPWIGPVTFGTNLGMVDAVSLVQSNFSTQFAETGTQGPGNLAVVARVGQEVVYFYRDDVAPFAWHGPTVIIATGATGNPSFVQARRGTYGTMGNYELVVPLLSGGIAHFYRDNDNPSQPWIGPTASFGTALGTVDGVSLIQSNFSTAGNGPGNLAVVSIAGNQMDYFYRDDE